MVDTQRSGLKEKIERMAATHQIEVLRALRAAGARSAGWFTGHSPYFRSVC